jgi:hypothetical protein
VSDSAAAIGLARQQDDRLVVVHAARQRDAALGALQHERGGGHLEDAPLEAGDAHALADAEGLAQVVRADHVGDVAARAEARRDHHPAEERSDQDRGEDGEPGDLDAHLVGADEQRRDQRRALGEARQRVSLGGREPRRGRGDEVGDESRQHIAGDHDEQPCGERGQVVEHPHQPLGEEREPQHLRGSGGEQREHHPEHHRAQQRRRALSARGALGRAAGKARGRGVGKVRGTLGDDA